MSGVRPRWIWVGVLVALVGLAVVSLSMTFFPSQVWLWLGVALVVAGLLLGWRSGMMHDVRRGPHGGRAEVGEVIEGETRPGTSPGRVLPVSAPPPPDAVTHNAGAPEGARLGPAPAVVRLHWLGIALAMLGGWMVLAPMLLVYPDTGATNDVILREYAVAGVLVLSGLWLRSPRSPAPVVAVPAIAGAALLLMAWLAAPLTTRAAVEESIAGILALGLTAGYAAVRLGPIATARHRS